HWPDKMTPLEQTMKAVDIAQQQGKIRCFGASNHSAWQICEMLWLADRHGGPKVVSSQIPFSLLRREFQHDLIFCQKHHVGVTPYQALQGGLLTGKYRRGQAPPGGSRAAEKPDWIWKTDDLLFNRLEGIEALAREAGVPLTQYALAWTLAHPAISSLIVGVKRAEQLQEAVAAAEVQLPAEHFARLDALSPPPWQQPDPLRG